MADIMDFNQACDFFSNYGNVSGDPELLKKTKPTRNQLIDATDKVLNNDDLTLDIKIDAIRAELVLVNAWQLDPIDRQEEINNIHKEQLEENARLKAELAKEKEKLKTKSFKTSDINWADIDEKAGWTVQEAEEAEKGYTKEQQEFIDAINYIDEKVGSYEEDNEEDDFLHNLKSISYEETNNPLPGLKETLQAAINEENERLEALSYQDRNRKPFQNKPLSVVERDFVLRTEYENVLNAYEELKKQNQKLDNLAQAAVQEAKNVAKEYNDKFNTKFNDLENRLTIAEDDLAIAISQHNKTKNKYYDAENDLLAAEDRIRELQQKENHSIQNTIKAESQLEAKTQQLHTIKQLIINALAEYHVKGQTNIVDLIKLRDAAGITQDVVNAKINNLKLANKPKYTIASFQVTSASDDMLVTFQELLGQFEINKFVQLNNVHIARPNGNRTTGSILAGNLCVGDAVESTVGFKYIQGDQGKIGFQGDKGKVGPPLMNNQGRFPVRGIYAEIAKVEPIPNTFDLHLIEITSGDKIKVHSNHAFMVRNKGIKMVADLKQYDEILIELDNKIAQQGYVLGINDLMPSQKYDPKKYQPAGTVSKVKIIDILKHNLPDLLSFKLELDPDIPAEETDSKPPYYLTLKKNELLPCQEFWTELVAADKLKIDDIICVNDLRIQADKPINAHEENHAIDDL